MFGGAWRDKGGGAFGGNGVSKKYSGWPQIGRAHV